MSRPRLTPAQARTQARADAHAARASAAAEEAEEAAASAELVDCANCSESVLALVALVCEQCEGSFCQKEACRSADVAAAIASGGGSAEAVGSFICSSCAAEGGVPLAGAARAEHVFQLAQRRDAIARAALLARQAQVQVQRSGGGAGLAQPPSVSAAAAVDAAAVEAERSAMQRGSMLFMKAFRVVDELPVAAAGQAQLRRVAGSAGGALVVLLDGLINHHVGRLEDARLPESERNVSLFDLHQYVVAVPKANPGLRERLLVTALRAAAVERLGVVLPPELGRREHRVMAVDAYVS